MNRIGTAAIIGVGLIGGSFGMALKKREMACHVIGIGRNPERLRKAVELGAIDSFTTDIESGVKEADLVYISTPVGMELDYLHQAVPHVKPGCVITDAGSVKAEICRGAGNIEHFIGGHPMAGSEMTGVEAGNPDLFTGATYVLTPTNHTNPEALNIMKGIAEGIGSKVIVLSSEAHDRCTAVISHLPHIIAAALVSLAEEHSERDPQIFELIAGSFRDMTRIAASSPVLWRDICMSNSESIKKATEHFQCLLDEGIKVVESGDGNAVEEWFSKAKEIKQGLI